DSVKDRIDGLVGDHPTQVQPARLADDAGGDTPSDSPQMALVGINPAVGQVLFADTRGKNLGSDQEHRLAHLVSFGEDCPQADSRKDVNGVGLADVVDRSAELE